MKKFKRLAVKEAEYYQMMDIQLYNRNKFQEHWIGSRKKLIVFNKTIATIKPITDFDLGMIKESLFVSFVARFNKQLYGQFNKNRHLLELNIPFKGIARRKNIKEWLSLKDQQVFYNIDLSSAYWQVAYRLGYIEEKFYYRFLNRYSHKKVKRYCFTFLVRRNDMIYHDGNRVRVITCDNEVFKQMYKNIRHELYNTIRGCLDLIGDHYIEFNIDGLSVHGRDLQTVMDYFTSLGYDFKTTLCIKKNDGEYMMGSMRRVFTKIPEKHIEKERKLREKEAENCANKDPKEGENKGPKDVDNTGI